MEVRDERRERFEIRLSGRFTLVRNVASKSGGYRHGNKQRCKKTPETRTKTRCSKITIMNCHFGRLGRMRGSFEPFTRSTQAVRDDDLHMIDDGAVVAQLDPLCLGSRDKINPEVHKEQKSCTVLWRCIGD